MVDIQRPIIPNDEVNVFKNNIHLADGTVIDDYDMDATKVMVKIINLHPENIKKMNYTLEVTTDAVLKWAINDLDFKKVLPLKKVKNPNGWKKNREKVKKSSGEAYLDSKGRTVESRIITSEEEVQKDIDNKETETKEEHIRRDVKIFAPKLADMIAPSKKN